MEEKERRDVEEKKANNAANGKLSWPVRLSYAGGDVACNVVFGMVGTLLTLFYTDYVGVAAATVGLIMLLSRFFDGFSDMIMGIIVEKTNSKWGKSRPWILWMSVPYALSAILLFTVPHTMGVVQSIYIFVTYNFCTTVCYTAINLPYGSLSAMMTRVSSERDMLSVVRMGLSPLGKIIAVTCTTPLVKLFGNDQAAWVKTMTVWAVIALILLLICFINCKETVVIAGQDKAEKVPVKKGLKLLLTNQYFWAVLLLWMFQSVSFSVSGTILPYYCKYILFIFNNHFIIMFFFNKIIPVIVSMSLCLGFIACDDNDENDDSVNTSIVVNPAKVFTGGLPKSVSGMFISQNKDGLVTSITTDEGKKAVFEYFPGTRAEASINSARITVTDENGDMTELNLQLNSDGYVEFCNSIDHAGTPDADEFTWEMEYDTEGHLVVMKRSESDGEITNITYKDGDVVKTSTRYVASGDLNGDGIIDSNDEWEYSAAIDYTTDNITAPIENKGCLMLFDEILDVDMDEMIYAYYGGMLGKATKHLPLVGHYTYNGEDSVSDMYFTWTLNSDSYPTELVVKDQWDEYRCTFTW